MRSKSTTLHGLIWTFALAALFAACQEPSEQTTSVAEAPAAEAPAAEAPASDETDVSWLYVASATGGSFDGQTITLQNVPPVLIFSDRPNRIYGHMTMSELLPMVKEGDDNFVVNPPNAVLSTFREGELPTEATVIMHDATADGANLLFSVDVLDGSIPATFGPASLFVDSHHGHHAAGAFIVGAAVANANDDDYRQTETVVIREPTYVYTVDPVPVAPAPAPRPVSAQSRLADAQRMFEQGLITEDEYARKREQILASM
jgi:hypothetical protein